MQLSLTATVTKNSEHKTGPFGDFSIFSIAPDDQKTPVFINCRANSRITSANILNKGDAVYLNGALSFQKYQDKETPALNVQHLKILKKSLENKHVSTQEEDIEWN